MGVVRHQFETQLEASAFVEGVGWVNDDVIEIVGIHVGEVSVIVVCEDEDSYDTTIVYVANGDGTYTREVS